ncbi:MAG: hypothetical protein ACD_75C00421G0001, partial [uncultured bacterium]
MGSQAQVFSFVLCIVISFENHQRQ